MKDNIAPQFGDWVTVLQAYDSKAHLSGKAGIYQGIATIAIIDDDGAPLGELETPLIRMPNGEEIYGFECWWERLE